MSTVFGLFDSRSDADAAVNSLYDAGYKKEDISFVTQEEANRQEGQEKGKDVAGGAAAGATTGGIIGGIAGLLIGIGAIALPGIGGILIGGPIAAALGLSGAAATTATGALTGALAGGLVGGLVNLGVPENEAREYEAGIKRGGIMIGARTDNPDEVRSILQNNNASRITETNK